MKRDNVVHQREKVNNGIIKIHKIGFVALGAFLVYGWLRPNAKVGPIAWIVFGLGMSSLIIPPFQPLIDMPFGLLEMYYSWRLERTQIC